MNALSAKKIVTTNIKKIEPQNKQLKMTKTEKRLNSMLRKALTCACENIKDSHSDFSHLTHIVNLKKPTNTLQVTCYFVDDLALSHAASELYLPAIESEINKQLTVIDIKPQTINFLAM